MGLYGKPTTVNNTQSFASVPTILRKGPEWFAGLGPPNSGGTLIFSVSGHVNRPGNFELPLGIPFADLLEIAGGLREGRRLKAVIPGGSSCPVLPASALEIDGTATEAKATAAETSAPVVAKAADVAPAAEANAPEAKLPELPVPELDDSKAQDSKAQESKPAESKPAEAKTAEPAAPAALAAPRRRSPPSGSSRSRRR